MEATTSTGSTNEQLGLGLKDGEAARLTKLKKATVISTASQQWYARPADERYLSLAALRASVADRRHRSRDNVTAIMENMAVRVDSDNKGLVLYDEKKQGPGARLTHWSFGQLSQRAGTPTAWLRKLGAENMQELVALNMNAGLANAEREDAKLLLTHDPIDGSATPTQLRALTGPNYGRIWDVELVDAIMRHVGDSGEWTIPAASYAATDAKRASTLYASDRDVFIFLVNKANPIEVPNEPGHVMFKGFYAANSETMNGSLVWAQFLYDTVCDNRNIWGVRDFAELRIRHTGGAPQRFVEQAMPAMRKYVEASTSAEVELITRAQRFELGKDIKAVKEKLAEKGFTKGQVQAALDYAETVPGNPRSLWNVEQGLTAVARDIEHTDARVDLEEKAGKLMAMVA